MKWYHICTKRDIWPQVRDWCISANIKRYWRDENVWSRTNDLGKEIHTIYNSIMIQCSEVEIVQIKLIFSEEISYINEVASPYYP